MRVIVHTRFQLAATSGRKVVVYWVPISNGHHISKLLDSKIWR